MKLKALLYLLPALFIFTLSVAAQNRFEGYSFVVEADNSGACPIKYFVWDDDIVLVDSCTREVVEIISGVA